MSFIRILFLSLLVGTSATLAQGAKNPTIAHSLLKLEFVPASIEPVFESHILSQAYPKKNDILTGAGWLFSGLKFRSAVDEFNALPPFDYRGYHPKDFSSFSSYLSKNYFLLKPIRTL